MLSERGSTTLIVTRNTQSRVSSKMNRPLALCAKVEFLCRLGFRNDWASTSLGLLIAVACAPQQTVDRTLHARHGRHCSAEKSSPV